MKNVFLLLVTLCITSTYAQKSVLGKWKSIDDETGKALGIVEIYEENGKIYGKIIDILIPKDRNKTCQNCEGEDKGKPILGLTVIKGLKKDGDEYNGGHILDPKHGKLYKCYLNLENEDKLKIRGYVGISLFGRTQYWHRIK